MGNTTHKFIDLITSTTLLPEWYTSFETISNAVLNGLPDIKRFSKTAKVRAIVSSKPNGNQVEYLKVDRKPDVNGANNIFVFQNADTIKTALQGVTNSTAKNSAKNADADICAVIGASSLEAVYIANGLTAYNTENKNKKATPEFIADVKAMGIGITNRSKFYAMQTVKEIAVKLKADVKTIKSLKVETYEPPTDNSGSRSKLYCVSGCDLNELLTQTFKADDIPNVQKVIGCRVHTGTLTTEPRKDIVKVAELIAENIAD